MPTQSSGPISFADLNSFLGTGQPVSINTLYRGGTFVPDITPNDHVPSTGTIDLQDLYDTWANKTLSFTMTVGSVQAATKKGRFYGYGLTTKSGSFGSLSTDTFLTPLGPIVIEGLYYSTNTHAWHLHLRSVNAPANSDLAFKSVSLNGYSFNGARSVATTTQVVGDTRRWNWVVKSTSHPTSGTISCTLNYYG
jgi:hypothetical protein